MAKKTQAQILQHEITKIKASDIGNLAAAQQNVAKAGDRLMASAVLVTITNLSGDVICETFAIHDGLSPETIKALQSDIRRTINLRLSMSGIKVD